MKKSTALFISTLGGCGYFPIASGTVGSAVTIPFTLVIAYYWGALGIALASVFLFFFGVYAIHYAIAGEHDHDPSHIVIDEAMGQFFTFLPVAGYLQGNATQNVMYLYAAGFFFFRLFDALKPQPARWADSCIDSAWGVMLDDFFASIYSAIAVYCVYYFFFL